MSARKEPDYLKEIVSLIEIPSVTGKEGRLANYLKERFESIGISARLYEVERDRYNVFALMEGTERGDELGVLFHAHIDTVSPYQMEEPFRAVFKRGYVYGRGAVDQKGGIAAIISAFERVVKVGVDLRRSVGFVGVIDEESEHRGSMFLRDMGLKASFGVVSEPTGLKLGIGCKGSLPIKVTVIGRASHGCRPWLGINAVEHGMKIAERILSSFLPRCEIDGVGSTSATFNLGMIRGGVAYNIVPDRCSLWFDRRIVPGEDNERVLEGVKRIVSNYLEEAKRNEKLSDLRALVEVARPDWNWEPIVKRGLKPALVDLGSEIVDVVRRAHRNVLGEEPKLFFTDGYNEMDFLINDMKIPSVQYGPGDASLCHTPNERLSLDELEKASLVYFEIIKSICS